MCILFDMFSFTCLFIFFLRIRRPPRSTRTDTLFPYTTLFRSEYARIVEVMPQGISMRLNVATAFDCPFDGPVAAHTTLALIDKLVSIFPGAEEIGRAHV